MSVHRPNICMELFHIVCQRTLEEVFILRVEVNTLGAEQHRRDTETVIQDISVADALIHPQHRPVLELRRQEPGQFRQMGLLV